MAQLTDKQRAGLARGRERGIKRRNTKTPNGTTWRDLIIAHGETACDQAPGKTWKQATVESAYRQAILGNAPILRELMQRSEPQEIGVAHSGKLVIEIVEDTTPFAASTRGAGADTE